MLSAALHWPKHTEAEVRDMTKFCFHMELCLVASYICCRMSSQQAILRHHIFLAIMSYSKADFIDSQLFKLGKCAIHINSNNYKGSYWIPGHSMLDP